jgi:UDP-N-acetylglucosamine 2-epimerase (non-hydrolysing)
MAPVIRELEGRKQGYFILHTGQHYSYRLDRRLFEQMELPQARYNLEVGSGSHAEQTAAVLTGVERVLRQECPDMVLVEGDTNSVLAGALAAAKLHIGVGHVEAGLRSYDRAMPEEINRILADHLADLLFAPSQKSRQILLDEGIPEAKIALTGNTIVDAVNENLEIARRRPEAGGPADLSPKGYFLVTVHRPENVDNRTRFASILEGLDAVAREFGVPLVYPVHPRSASTMERFGLRPRRVRLTEPVDFLTFLKLESNAGLILTDSGGVQEEACILGVPCVTLRDNTERPETLEVGANILAGASPGNIVACARTMFGKRNGWGNPFGDGRAAKRIVSIMEERL